MAGVFRVDEKPDEKAAIRTSVAAFVLSWRGLFINTDTPRIQTLSLGGLSLATSSCLLSVQPRL